MHHWRNGECHACNGNRNGVYSTSVAGGGANLLQILQRCPQGKAYGIDISPESVTFARKKNKKYLGTRCFIEQGGVHRLPYPDYAFDAVTAFETVYFWGNLQHAFTEVARVLKPGGSFLICCEISDPANKAGRDLLKGWRFIPVMN